ncbi:MAG: carbon-nitrogen hydrolase family protein [Phycisphaerae bacterium]
MNSRTMLGVALASALAIASGVAALGPGLWASNLAGVPTNGPGAASRPAATVKVAAIQFMSEFGRPAENRKRLEPLIRQAAKAGAKIIVLPEAAITGYASTDLKQAWQLDGREMGEGLAGVSPKDAAETVPGESTRAMCKLAGELGIYLTVPLVEVDPKSGRYFNTIVLAGPKGEQLLHYRKLNPWPWAEKAWATKGDHGHQYIDTPYGRLALLICYDINFEPPRLKEARIDVLLYCIAWVDRPNSDWYARRLPAIARQNNFHIIGANWTVPAAPATGPAASAPSSGPAIRKPDWYGYGQSRIISRDGEILSKVGKDIGEEIIYAELPVPAGAP